MLELLEVFRLTFSQRDPVFIAASSMQEALSLATKLPNFTIGEIESISSWHLNVFV